jgi:hypothetical protein
MPKEARNGGKFSKLKELPYFDEIDRRIRAGFAVEEVAEWMQEDLNLRTEIKRESLVRQLYRYKKDIPPGELLTENEPLYVRKAVEKMGRGIDELEEMKKLYLYQLKRISIDGSTESKINKLFGSQSKEIKLAYDMLQQMMQKKMELGILSKAPEKVDVTGTMTGGILNVTPNEVDEGDKQKLGLAAGKILQALAQKKGIEQDEEETE